MKKLKKYKYVGEIEVELANYGIIQPGQTIEVDFVINHPNFEVVADKKKDKDKDDSDEKESED